MVSDTFENNGFPNNETGRIRVGIVGAGAAGLCAIRHFNKYPDRFEVTAYEQGDGIGGTWKYNERTGKDENGLPIHSSMYKNLHTNLPMEIMTYPDFKPKNTRSYVHHSEVLKYLTDYAEHFNLFPYINFCHISTLITRSNNEWVVKIKDLKQSKEFRKRFDVILICTGRYSIPSWPDYDSLKLFEGNVIHSHDYRIPEVYKGQSVAVVGGGLSGVDISLEISRHAEEVIFVNRSNNFYQNMHENIHQIKVDIQGFGPDSMIVKNEDGDLETYRIDSIVMATGYKYDVKFIDEKCGITMNPDGTIDGLYRHLINIEHPSMALFAVPNRVLPLPLFHQQLLYYLKILLDEYKLPSKKQMIMDTEQDIAERLTKGFRPKDRHMLLVDMMEKYLVKLEEESHIKPLPKVFIKLHRDLYNVRKVDIVNYKRFDYKLISDDEYQAIERKRIGIQLQQ